MSAATDKGVLAVMLEAAWPLAEAGEFLLPKRLLAARDVVAELIEALRMSAEAIESAAKCVGPDLALVLSDRAMFARAALGRCGGAQS